MSVQIPDKNSVEGTLLGQLNISLLKVTDEWTKQENLDALRDAIVNIKEDIEKRSAAGCRLLRLVIVTSDITQEIFRWQKKLGYPELTSTDENAVVAGKTLTWGDGQLGSTFSIIILSEVIGRGLISEDMGFKNLASGVFAHELAHVHDDFIGIHVFGPESTPANDDWIGIQQYFARIIWSEYFAESVAYVYLEESTISNQIGLCLKMMQSCNENIKREIIDYRSNGDIGQIWNYSCSEISKTLNQLGRVMGLLAKHSDDSLRETLIDQIGEISPSLSQLANQLYDELQLIDKNKKWDDATFDNLAIIVSAYFHLNGLYPIQNSEGLRLNIPLSK